MDKVIAAGYDGIEWGIAGETDTAELEAVLSLAACRGMPLIAQHYDTAEADFNRHYDTYAAWLERMKAYPWRRINSQTGKDHFSMEQNIRLIELAGDGVCHETHRGKFSFAAHITRPFLEAMPTLRLTLDLSHWVAVAESFLEDQPGAVATAITRTDHIHARVGYTEGPQVPHPQVPEWAYALEHHLGWWDAVVDRHRAAGTAGSLTVTPEFGPHPYMVHLPHARTPIADQWSVNLFMMNLLKDRYV